MAQAYLLYSEAAAMDPSNQMYWLRSQAVKSRAALEGKVTPKIDPEAVTAEAHRPLLQVRIPEATAADRAEAARPQPPSELSAENVVRDFDLREDSQKLYQDVAHTFGLDCVFDADYQPMPTLRFELQGVNYRDALHALELATGTFLVPISNKVFLVVKDTPQKRAEQAPVAAIAIPVPPSINPQDFNALVTSVQQVLGIQKAAFDTRTNTVVLRDSLAKILPAKALIEDLSKPHPQVMIETRFLQISRNDALTYGIDFPTLFSLQPLTTWMNNQVRLPTSVSGLLTFGAGKSLIGIGIMNASLVAQLSQSTSNLLLGIDLRGLDNQPETLHIGERYPVLTAGYYGNTGAVGTTGIPSTGTTTIPTTSTGTATGILTLSQTSVTWNYSSGGDLPQAASISVTSTSGTIGFTATVVSSSPWLTVNSQATASGTLPATLTIAPGANLSGLEIGSYLGIVQVSGSDGSIAYVTVNLAVNNGAQNLTLSPSAITLETTAGGLEVQQVVAVTSTSGGVLAASVTGTGLSIVAADATAAAGTPASVTVLANPAALSAQTYLGVLSVMVGEVTAEEQVSFTVQSSGSLQLSQNSVPWTYSSGGSLPQAVNVTVTSTNGATSFTATAGSVNSWLLVNGQTSVSGSVPATLTLSPSSGLTQLGTGTYKGTVQLTAGDGSVAYLDVNLTVNGGTATGLEVSPNPVLLNASPNGSTVQQTITVTSVTAGTLTATVTGSGLSVSLPTTTVAANTPVTFTLSANPAGLTSQTYVGQLSIGVADVTQNLEVTFSVGAINSGTNGTSIYTPIPSFTFEDLGLTLKVTPSVHNLEEMTLDIDAEFKVLTGQSLDGIPVISNRLFKSKARLRGGEWAVVGGLLDTQEARNIAGLAGAARLPGLGPLFSTHQRNTSQDEVLILMRPHLLNAPDQSAPHAYATGTDTKPLTLF